MKEPQPPDYSPSRIVIVVVLCVSTAAIVTGYAISRPFTDLGVYFTATHIYLEHGDPYSMPEVLQAQKNLGFHEPIPIMFMCPPWVLTMLAPLGFFHSYTTVWLCWFAILATCVAIASKLLMDVYFGGLNIPEISYPLHYRYFFAFTFYPVLMALKFAQLSPMVLLGVAGLTHYHKRKRPVIAGFFLSLTLLKPHLVLLLWVALFLSGRWKILATSAAVALAFSIATVIRYPAAFKDYFALMAGPYPKLTVSGLLAGVRGILQTPNSFWIQYIPLAVGLVWVLLYWRKHRHKWELSTRLPALITASIMAAPYGYTHDQILLIIPNIYLAAHAAWRFGKIPFNLVAMYTALNISVLIVLILWVHWAILIAPLTIGAMLMTTQPRQPENRESDLRLAATT